MSLVQALLGTVLPVFVLAALGWVARRRLNVEVRDPSRLAVYLFTPGLIANSILTTRLVSAEIGKILAFGALLTAVMITVTLALGRLIGWGPAVRNASVLSTGFMNAANYGLPVVLLAFGTPGYERATIFIVFETLMMYSTAVFFAARGRMDWRGALLAIFKLPLVWAVLASLAVRLLGIPLPDAITKSIGMLANGAVVLVVIILGMQVAGIQIRGAIGRIIVSALLRLILSPVVGLGLVALLQPDPLTAKVLVLESAMPASVNTMLLAVQFDAEPDQVSGVTLLSTLLSVASVTFWVWFLKR